MKGLDALSGFTSELFSNGLGGESEHDFLFAHSGSGRKKFPSEIGVNNADFYRPKFPDPEKFTCDACFIKRCSDNPAFFSMIRSEENSSLNQRDTEAATDPAPHFFNFP